MSLVNGYFYDGKSSARTLVSVVRSGDELILRGEGLERHYLLAGVKVSAPVGDTRRSLRFADGALCEIINDSAIDLALGDETGGLFQRLLNRWERSMTLALLALVLTVGVIAAFIKYGIPAIAKQVAFAIPPATEKSLGKESLAFLDKLVMQPSQLPESRKKELTALFSRMRQDLPGGQEYLLDFRKSDRIGANAFALPGGTIVITDGLVKLAKNDEEIVAVLAHEAGHVRNRHILRHVLQSSGTGLLIAAVTGDVTSITSLSAALPTSLIDARYSREFEYEADDAAVDYLVRRRIPRQRYADMLARLQAEYDRKRGEKGGEEEQSSLGDLFASHPVTSERISRIMGHGR
ncbi:MAG: M48 family metalloprotease [Geobacter sp.]|nr:M48 family metalloprotease [Geobacter sp.]